MVSKKRKAFLHRVFPKEPYARLLLVRTRNVKAVVLRLFENAVLEENMVKVFLES